MFCVCGVVLLLLGFGWLSFGHGGFVVCFFLSGRCLFGEVVLVIFLFRYVGFYIYIFFFIYKIQAA